MAYIGSFVDTGRTARCLQYFNRPDLLFFIARTTAWGGLVQDPRDADNAYYTDLNPPPADFGTRYTDLIEVIAYKKVKSVQIIVADPNGTIALPDNTGGVVTYSAKTPAQALALGARTLLFTAELVSNEVPLTTFRQYGICSSIQGNPNNTSIGQSAFLPNQVTAYTPQPWGASPIILEFLKNVGPIQRTVGRTQKFQVLGTF